MHNSILSFVSYIQARKESTGTSAKLQNWSSKYVWLLVYMARVHNIDERALMVGQNFDVIKITISVHAAWFSVFHHQRAIGRVGYKHTVGNKRGILFIVIVLMLNGWTVAFKIESSSSRLKFCIRGISQQHIQFYF